jgi:alpha-1,2-mannosyltransferase
MVNSSWTKAHIEALWWRISVPRLVHPPCDTRALQALPLDRKFKRLYLVSLAQFRPEKDHTLQLQAFARARQLATVALMESSAGDLDIATMPWDAAQVGSLWMKPRR